MSDRQCLCLALSALLLGGAAWTGNTAEPAEGRIAGEVRYTGTVPADQVIPTTGLQERQMVVVEAGKTALVKVDWEKAPGK